MPELKLLEFMRMGLRITICMEWVWTLIGTRSCRTWASLDFKDLYCVPTYLGRDMVATDAKIHSQMTQWQCDSRCSFGDQACPNFILAYIFRLPAVKEWPTNHALGYVS